MPGWPWAVERNGHIQATERSKQAHKQAQVSASELSPKISAGTCLPAPGEAEAAAGMATGDSSLLRGSVTPECVGSVWPPLPEPLFDVFPVAPSPGWSHTRDLLPISSPCLPRPISCG